MHLLCGNKSLGGMLMILRKFLGEIMVDLGFVTRQQLEEALKIQRKKGREKILPGQIQAPTLVSQARLAADADVTPLLGRILMDMGYAKKGQIEKALREQDKMLEVYKSLESEKLGTAIEISSIVHSTLNLSEVLKLIMKYVNRVTDSVASTMMLLDDETRELVFSVPTGPKEESLIDIRIPTDKGIAGWVVEHEEPVLVPDVREDPRFSQEIDKTIGFETKSVLCAPIKARTKLIGVLEVINKVDNTSFTEEDALILTIFAHQAAIAIENARLHGELKDRLEERKLAEEALRESKGKLRAMLESIGDNMCMMDRELDIIWVNENAKRVCGDDIVGKKCYEVFHGRKEPCEPFPCIVLKAFKDGKIHQNDTQLIDKDGNLIYFHCTANVALKDKDGKPTAVMEIFRDITQQKRLEAQVQQAKKMEAIGTLAGGIAHDFNNLLMAIQGNASLMLFKTDHNHQHYKMLKSIEKLVESGAKLTRQLLGYASEGRYEVKSINLEELVEETSETFGRTRKEITIHRDLAEDLSAIEADQGQIEQVLLNLYVNASEAMSYGGDIFLKATNMAQGRMKGKLYDPKPGKYVLLTVRDTGKGMDKETQERIFEPFFTTKEMSGGTGLGLASVYGIIKGHGGYIDVESEKDHGTTFNIYLPASEKKVEKTTGSDQQIIDGKGTILLVDDEEMVLDIGVKILQHLGYKVLEARAGKEAVETYKTNGDKLDLVILDMVMPEMGGGEVYDRMKEINSNVKVLLSSGYSVDGQAKEILDRGCDDFIQKPFTMRELSGKLSKLLSN
jgi:PAS domain S-box-containing protein